MTAISRARERSTSIACARTFLRMNFRQRSFSFLACLLFIPIAFTQLSWAEKGILVVQVKDIQKKAVTGVTVTVEGSAEAAISDAYGRARIKLDPQTEVNDWAALQIRSPQGKDLVLISPWDQRAQVPPFQKESVNYVPLVVANRGDRALLESGTAIVALAAKINKANSPRAKESDPEQQRKEALETVAESFGLAPADVDKAIRAWGEKTEDPYEQGLAALYEKNYPLASAKLAESFEARKKDLEKAQAAAADAAFFLGESKYEEGKYRESVAAYQEALKLRPDDPVVLNNLALSLDDSGDYAKAEPVYRRALTLQDNTLRSDDPGLALTMNNLAALLYEKGDYAEAEPLFRRALAIDEKALGPGHPHVARDLNNLAVLLDDKGDYAGAEPLFRRALSIDEKALGPDHPGVATDLNNLALLLNGKGDYTGAEPLFRRALAIDENALGPDHPGVATDLNDLGELLRIKGDYAEAEPLFRRALAIDEKALGPDHPGVATDLNNLALLLDAKRDYAGAEPLYRRALVIDEKALGLDHPKVAIRLNNLAGFLREKRDYEGAEQLYRQALAIDEKALGSDHPSTQTIKHNLQGLLAEKQKAEKP